MFKTSICKFKKKDVKKKKRFAFEEGHKIKRTLFVDEQT